MNIDKAQIIELLKSRGDDAKVQQAETSLPDTVDTDQHKGLLDSLGLDIGDLVKQLPGLGGLGL
jgi:hypothetical protein